MDVTAEEMALIRQQEYLKPSEAAILVRKSQKTVYDAIYAGDLGYLQHGSRYFIPRDELDAWTLRLAGKDPADKLDEAQPPTGPPPAPQSPGLPPTWMDSKEAAAYLRMNHSEFKVLAACGEIPRHEVRPNRYRYHAPELTEWLLGR